MAMTWNEECAAKFGADKPMKISSEAYDAGHGHYSDERSRAGKASMLAPSHNIKSPFAGLMGSK